MPNLIKFFRGAKANMPILQAGQPAFTTDTKELFVGDGTKNYAVGKTNSVNVRDFGAVGNARYYDHTARTWWANAAKTIAPTDDGAAIQAAIDYAIANNVNTVYFPDGYYYTVNRTFTFSRHNLRFVGQNESQLISVGLTAPAAFITIDGIDNLSAFENVNCVLQYLSLKGNYFLDDTQASHSNSVKGVMFKNITYQVHGTLKDLCIQGFNVGIYCNQGTYKNSFWNIDLLACDIGIYCLVNSVIPLHVYNLYCEACARAIVSGGNGFSTITVNGGAFEYNRQCYNGLGEMIFTNVRFEMDLKSSCTNALSPINVFHCGDSYHSVIVFNNCQFLFLNTYAANTSRWILSPKLMTNPTTNIVYQYAPMLQAAHAITFANCQYSSDQIPASGMIADCAVGRVGVSNFEIQTSTNVVVSKMINCIDQDWTNKPPQFDTNITAQTFSGTTWWRIATGAVMTFKYDRKCLQFLARLNMDVTSATASVAIKTVSTSKSVTLRTVPLVQGVNVLNELLNPAYDTVTLTFTTNTNIHLNGDVIVNII